MTQTTKDAKSVQAKTTTKNSKQLNKGQVIDVSIAVVSLLVFAAATFRDIQLELRGNPYVGVAVSVLVVFYGTSAVAKVILHKVK
jgi:hypothetical protein